MFYYVGSFSGIVAGNSCFFQVNSPRCDYPSFLFPVWEQQVEFSSDEEVSNIRTHPTWVTLSGERPQPAVHCDTSSILKNTFDFDVLTLPVRDPTHVVSGGLSQCIDEWEKIAADSSSVLDWLPKGVSVFDFSSRLTEILRVDPTICQYQSIKAELIERVWNGSLRLLGNIGLCELPHLVMPLVVEESKPRLCHVERFLNPWIRNPSFQLENLKHVHRIVGPGARMVSFGAKSGYNHIKLSANSETFFGIQFAGWLFTYTTLPFGWFASPNVYQTVGTTVTSYLCSLGVLNTQYIDDRMAAEAFTLSKQLVPGRADARCLSYALVELLTRLGYTLALHKLVVFPTTSLRHLGFTIDSVKQAYLLPDDKRRSFADLKDTAALCR